MTEPTIDPESEEKMREAGANPAAIEFTVVGRNGFRFTQRIPLYDYETGEISTSVDIKRREINELGYADPTGWEAFPYSRVFTFTLETRIR